MKKRSKVGEYKTVFKGVDFTVMQAEAIMPSGAVKVFERASRANTVGVLAFDEKGRLLLTREYREHKKRYEWRIPCGVMEEGETPKQAAQRELREEAGYRAKKLTLFHASDSGQRLDWKFYTYLADDITKDALPGDEDEDITVIPTPLKKAVALVRAGEIETDRIAYLILKLAMKKGVL